jgi:iron complex transport system permease protein
LINYWLSPIIDFQPTTNVLRLLMRTNTAPAVRDWRQSFPFFLGVALFAAMILSLCVGAYPVPLATVARITAALVWPAPLQEHPSWTLTQQIVVQSVRLSRIVLATLAGVGLGLSGAALQGMMRNPLVGPDIVGVTSGAAFGGVLALLLGFSPLGTVALAFCGGLLALILASGLARLAKGSGVLPMILSGVVVGAFFAACVSLLLYLADPFYKLPNIVYWLLGSFAGATRQKVMILAIPTFGAGAVILGLRWRLNLLSLGDLDAAALGLGVQPLRWSIVGLVSLIIAAQVSVSGGVGWVGLVVPHFARMLVGPDHRRLVPTAGILGGIFLLAIDNIARCITVQEVPIGVLTALVGTPIFAFMLWRTQTNGWTNE